jgi:hypothetical protein
LLKKIKLSICLNRLFDQPWFKLFKKWQFFEHFNKCWHSVKLGLTFFFKRCILIFLWISDFKFELSIKFWIKWILEWPSSCFFFNSDQKPIPDRLDRVFRVFWSVFFLNHYDDDHLSIHFIQNLMLNSNLKSDIQSIQIFKYIV